MANDLTNLSVREVAFCRRGMNKNARIALFKAEPDALDAEAYLKRDFSADDRKRLAQSGAAMPGGGFPIETVADLKNAVLALGRAKDQAAAKKHIISRARSLDALDSLPEEWNVAKADIFAKIMGAIRKALPDMPSADAARLEARLKAVPGDPDGDILLFDEAITDSQMNQKLWDATSAVQRSIQSIITDDDATDKAALLSKTLEEFTSYIQGLVGAAITKSGPGADIDQGAGMSDAIKKSLGLEPTATDAEVTAALAKKDEDAAAALAKMQNELNILKLSDAHSKYADAMEMSDDAKGKFAAKTPAERDAQIADKPPVAKAVDPMTIELAKRDKEIELLKGDVAKAREETEIAAIAKRMDVLKFAGDPAENAALIHQIGKTDKAAAEAFEKRLETLNKQVAEGELLKEHGSGVPGIVEATKAIQVKAVELQKADPKMSIEKARTLARDQNPELAKQEQTELAAKR